MLAHRHHEHPANLTQRATDRGPACGTAPRAPSAMAAMLMALSPTHRVRAAAIGAGLRLVGDAESSKICFRAAFTGQWEGHEQDRFRNRPGRRTAAQDTDLNFGVRELLISEARALEQTFPITRRIRNKYPDYCVGKCKIKWNTGDPAVDKLYEANWENFKTRSDANGVHNFPKQTKIAVGHTIGDGDIFAQMLNSGGYLQLRLIEADRVTSSGNFNADTLDMVGGIGLANGRPAFIRVWNRTLYGTFDTYNEIPRPNFLHLFNSKREDARRGVTAYHAVLNPLRDMKETVRAEQLAMKRNSKLALIYKTITGRAPEVDLLGTGTAVDSPTGTTMREVNDSVEEYMYPGEDIKTHSSDRPGDNWLPMMEFIIRNIAIGVDLPFGVLWHMAGMGKPAILADLQAAARTFAGFMDEIEWKWIRPVAGVETALAWKAGRLPFHPNWWKFIVGRPPPITIDAGRDSKSGLEENRMGMRSVKSWYFETEDDWQEETEQTFIEAAFRRDMGTKYNIDPNQVRIISPNGNSASAQPMGEGTDPNKDQAE